MTEQNSRSALHGSSRLISSLRLTRQHLLPTFASHISFDPGGKAQAQDLVHLMMIEASEAQMALFAEGQRSVLFVFQGMDTSGKDGVVRHVFSQLNPQGLWIANFKRPEPREQARDFLWRIHHEIPPRGHVGIFNRSHYEDLIVPLAKRLLPKHHIEQRIESVKDFERHLSNNGYTIVKILLHIDRAEQHRRLVARLESPKKHWKLDLSDFEDRHLWRRYQSAYQQILLKTHFSFAPWYVIPANTKWYRDLLVANIVLNTLKNLSPKFPRKQFGEIQKLKRMLRQ